MIKKDRLMPKYQVTFNFDPLTYEVEAENEEAAYCKVENKLHDALSDMDWSNYEVEKID